MLAPIAVAGPKPKIRGSRGSAGAVTLKPKTLNEDPYNVGPLSGPDGRRQSTSVTFGDVPTREMDPFRRTEASMPWLDRCWLHHKS